MGLVAGLLYTIIVLISVAPFRNRFFELFYLSHVVLVLCVTSPSHKHTKLTHLTSPSAFILLSYLHSAASNFGYYVWPCFVVWGFDRVCRYIRYLLLTDLALPSSPSNQATLELVTPDAVRVSVPRRKLALPWTAGQHMYLALPTLGPVESHPFTIATVASDDVQEDEVGKEMVWIIRARDGFTKRVKEYVMANSGSTQVPVFMHGPYGAPPDITPYSTCVFIAGEILFPSILCSLQ